MIEVKTMRFLFSCGGTAGHVNPALGVAARLRELIPDCEILFIGANGKMEMDLVPREGYEIRGVPILGLSRSLSVEGIIHNVHFLNNLMKAGPACRKILREFRPDVVVGTGGYVCYPVVREATRLGIPTAVHESNAEPGLTTRLLEGDVNKIMVGFEEARANYKHPDKVVVTGTPVRLGFMRTEKAEARRQLGIPEDEKLVVSVWGSLGATEMNKSVARMIALAMQEEERPFRLVHSAGKRGIDDMNRQMSEELGLSGWNEAGFEVTEYIYDMATWMAAADLVLCRSGASTLAELTAIAKPAILVPSPNVVHAHQEKNARVLERGGGAVVLLEENASPETMLSTIKDLLADKAKLTEMEEHMHDLAVENATDEITSIVLSLAAKE